MSCRAPTSPHDALSCREIEKFYRVSRSLPASLVRTGQVPGLRRGRAILILRVDWEAWWRSQAAAQHGSAEERVREVLQRHGANAAPSP